MQVNVLPANGPSEVRVKRTAAGTGSGSQDSGLCASLSGAGRGTGSRWPDRSTGGQGGNQGLSLFAPDAWDESKFSGVDGPGYWNAGEIIVDGFRYLWADTGE